jgi:hypothetical protein
VRIWRAKWNLLRLAIAAFLLWAVAGDTGARLARLQLASLPDFDYASEVRFLRDAGRYGEAVMVADAGLDALSGDARAALEAEKHKTVAAQGSYLRRARDLGLGALSGRGDSLEGLIGAVAADFFVVGDVRDLVIQGGRLVMDGETDEVILVLSGVGLATTLAPEVDWVPSILKAAKKSGAMSRRMGEHIVKLARAGKHGELMPLFRDVRKLAQHASPGGAIRMLRLADDPQDLARITRFVESQKAGAFALHVAGREGADVIKGSTRVARAAGNAGQAAAEEAVILAAHKGDKGIAWLRTGAYRAMARPHLLVGIGKMFYKGNAEKLAARIAAALDPRAWWIVPLLGAWVFVELAGLIRGSRRASVVGVIVDPVAARTQSRTAA